MALSDEEFVICKDDYAELPDIKKRVKIEALNRDIKIFPFRDFGSSHGFQIFCRFWSQYSREVPTPLKKGLSDLQVRSTYF